MQHETKFECSIMNQGPFRTPHTCCVSMTCLLPHASHIPLQSSHMLKWPAGSVALQPWHMPGVITVREDCYFLPIVEPSCPLCTEPIVEEVPGMRQRPSFVKSHDLSHIELLYIAADNLALLAYCLQTAMSYRAAVTSFVMGPCSLTVLTSPKTPCSTFFTASVPGIIKVQSVLTRPLFVGLALQTMRKGEMEAFLVMLLPACRFFRILESESWYHRIRILKCSWSPESAS